MNQPGNGEPAPHPTLRTRICELFGVSYPIIQTGMGYVSGPELTAATAQAGGLGIIGGGSMTYDELVAAVRRVKESVIMAANAPVLYRTALADGNAELGVMATDQVVGLIEDLPSCGEPSAGLP
ncbi:MAG TPA: nitronate monooxygenase [Trebonia sp.]